MNWPNGPSVHSISNAQRTHKANLPIHFRTRMNLPSSRQSPYLDVVRKGGYALKGLYILAQGNTPPRIDMPLSVDMYRILVV
jgi:hypothetical protein